MGGAEAVPSALLAQGGGGEVFPDEPAVNCDAVKFAESVGRAPVFETAPMNTGAIPELTLQRVYGVTTFELGQEPQLSKSSGTLPNVRSTVMRPSG
jgi:hypothetical protein